MPFDDFRDQLDNRKVPDARVMESSLGRITQSESADDHIKLIPLNYRQGDIRQSDFALNKLARHQVAVVEFYFPDVFAIWLQSTTTQDQLANGCLLPCNFFEHFIHRWSIVANKCFGSQDIPFRTCNIIQNILRALQIRWTRPFRVARPGAYPRDNSSSIPLRTI